MGKMHPVVTPSYKFSLLILVLFIEGVSDGRLLTGWSQAHVDDVVLMSRIAINTLVLI